MKVKVIKKNSLQLDFFLKKNVPVIIQKNFFSKNICKKIIKYCIDLSRNNPQRKLTQKKEFYSIDVNPQGAITQRILRKFMLGKNFLKKFNKVNELINFQYNKILKPKKKFTPEIAVVHYPRGGGILPNINIIDIQLIMALLLPYQKKGMTLMKA